jgi:hypothetical protein
VEERLLMASGGGGEGDLRREFMYMLDPPMAVVDWGHLSP